MDGTYSTDGSMRNVGRILVGTPEGRLWRSTRSGSIVLKRFSSITMYEYEQNSFGFGKGLSPLGSIN
jgi:hypothetical protein